jgi:hypothetical protein
VKIVTYIDENDTASVGVALENGIIPTGYTSVRDFIMAGPDGHDELRRRAGRSDPGHLVVPKRITAPVGADAKLLWAGGNYQDHLAEVDLHPKEQAVRGFFGAYTDGDPDQLMAARPASNRSAAGTRPPSWRSTRMPGSR